jgi:hypothetical protein
MRALLRTLGESLLRLMEQSEDALAVWDEVLTDDATAFSDLDAAGGA